MARTFFIVVSTAAFACGGAAPPSMSPSSNDTTPVLASPESSTAAGRAPDVGPARGDLDRAEKQLEAAQGDCATACRALASMERAAEHICALGTGSECGKARERVQAARDRIRATCGGCGQ